MPPELSMSDAKIWSITLESSIMIVEASVSLIYCVLSTGINYDDRQLRNTICLYYKPQGTNCFLFKKGLINSTGPCCRLLGQNFNIVKCLINLKWIIIQFWGLNAFFAWPLHQTQDIFFHIQRLYQWAPECCKTLVCAIYTFQLIS